jgi:hypothetical protein
MHSEDARAAGETEQRRYALNAWRETPFFTEHERAALPLTEAVTLIAQEEDLQSVTDEACSVFTAEELTRPLYLIIDINAWNRFGNHDRTSRTGELQAESWVTAPPIDRGHVPPILYDRSRGAGTRALRTEPACL